MYLWSGGVEVKWHWKVHIKSSARLWSAIVSPCFKKMDLRT